MARRYLPDTQCQHTVTAFHLTTTHSALCWLTHSEFCELLNSQLRFGSKTTPNTAKMKKPHTFGTKSIPLKKLQKNARRGKASVSLRSANPTDTAMHVAGKIDSDRNDSRFEPASAAPVEQIALPNENTESQAVLAFEHLDEKSSPNLLPSLTSEPAPTATLLSGPTILAPTVSSSKTKPTATPPLNPLDLHTRVSSPPLEPTTPAPSPESPLLFPSGRLKPLDFPGLDVLPPARLYGDDQTPSSSWVPFAKDESVSQEHARRNFLRLNFSHGTWMPVRPGTAVRKL